MTSFPSVADLCPDPAALGLKLDVQGWHADDPVFAKLILPRRPDTVIEIGSWKGASAITMAKLMDQAPGHMVPWQIFCCDTWLGGGDHYVNQDKPENNLLRDKFGFPCLYHQFLFNIATTFPDSKDQAGILPLLGHAHYIHPIAQPSVSGARILGRAGITADLIYVDASHVYEDVFADLTAYGILLKPGGVMFGDDWEFMGVRLAVTRFAFETGFALKQEGHGWQLRREQ